MRQLIYISLTFVLYGNLIFHSVYTFWAWIAIFHLCRAKVNEDYPEEALWSFWNVMCLPLKTRSRPGVKNKFSIQMIGTSDQSVVNVKTTCHCPSKLSPFNSFLKTRPTIMSLKEVSKFLRGDLLHRFGHDQKF